MKNVLNFKFLLVVITIYSTLLLACSEEIAYEQEIQKTDEELKTKSSPVYGVYFDWDRVNEFPMKYIYGGTTTTIQASLPWANGVSSKIPLDWFDDDAFNSDFSKRKYARENNWALVYSNLMANDMYKYLALYNKHTGILRFFFYALSPSSGTGTSQSYWGIQVMNPTSLLNFTSNLCEGISTVKSSPMYATSPPGTIDFGGSTFSSGGYQVNTWYGLEIECAYDPSINLNSRHKFKLYGWAANNTRITGTGVTSGQITGTIEYAAPNTTISPSLSNMFNDNSTESYKSISANNNNGIINGLGETIQAGVNRGDNFFTSLWNNIKSKAGSGIGDGVKTGLAAIVGGGGSVVAKALGSVLSSILGISGNDEPSIGKVDLSLSANSTFTFTSETVLSGWGETLLTVPGATNIFNDEPIYNKPLGVWNLTSSPKVAVDLSIANIYDGNQRYPIIYDGSARNVRLTNYKYKYRISSVQIMLNPEISGEFTIRNLNTTLVTPFSTQMKNLIPYGLLNGKQPLYKNFRSIIFGSEWVRYNGSNSSYFFNQENFEVYCHVEFDLVHDSGDIYSISKYFKVIKQPGTVEAAQLHIDDAGEFDFM